MASSKRKTTMNKLNRERKVLERRLDKQARKVARANAPAEESDFHMQPHELGSAQVGESSASLQQDPHVAD